MKNKNKEYSEDKAELLNLTQRAEKLELVNEEMALKIYLQIFDTFEPNVSKTYESTIRLLEKRNRYQDAMDICDRALKMIDHNQMSQTQLDKFQNLQSRITKKLEEQGLSPRTTKNRKNLNAKSILAMILILLTFFAILLFATPYGNFIIKMGEKEGDLGIDDQPKGSVKYKIYIITDKMIDYAKKNISRNPEVTDVTLIVEEDLVKIDLITTSSQKERGKAMIKQYLDYIGDAASKEYTNLSKPTEEKLGEIFDYYALNITATANRKIYLKATKEKDLTTLEYESEDHQTPEKNVE